MTGVRGMRVAAFAIAALAIAGCAADDPTAPPEPSPSIPAPVVSEPPPSSSPEPSASPSEEPADDDAGAPEPTASATPTPTTAPLAGLSLQLSCDRVLTAQDMYDYNPNVGADPGYRPRPGSGPAMAVELSGTACGLLNQTSTQTYSIGVARFDAANLERVKRAAANAGGTTEGLGLDGYYRTQSGLGIVDAFTGSYWISAESSAFLEPADALPLLEAIRRNLP